MPKKSTKSKSKRTTLKQKYKPIKKVKEHHKKKRREENRKMNACLSQYTNEAAFEEYKLRRSIELAKQGKKGGA